MVLRVTDLDGQIHEIQAQAGETLLEALLAAGLPVKATCFGCCNCSTCHVAIDPAWYDRLPAPEEQECDVMELAGSRNPTSRLACQIIVDDGMSGMDVTLMAETAG